jgi:hypothetical protein
VRELSIDDTRDGEVKSEVGALLDPAPDPEARCTRREREGLANAIRQLSPPMRETVNYGNRRLCGKDPAISRQARNRKVIEPEISADQGQGLHIQRQNTRDQTLPSCGEQIASSLPKTTFQFRRSGFMPFESPSSDS